MSTVRSSFNLNLCNDPVSSRHIPIIILQVRNWGTGGTGVYLGNWKWRWEQNPFPLGLMPVLLLLHRLSLVLTVHFPLSSLFFMLFHINFLVFEALFVTFLRLYGGGFPAECYFSFSGMKLKAQFFCCVTLSWNTFPYRVDMVPVVNWFNLFLTSYQALNYYLNGAAGLKQHLYS